MSTLNPNPMMFYATPEQIYWDSGGSTSWIEAGLRSTSPCQHTIIEFRGIICADIT